MQIYLGFHGIGTPGPGIEDDERPYWLPIDRFHAVLDLIAAARQRSTANHIGITFDDGNRSDLEHGLPALIARGLTADVFIVSARIGQPGYLSAEDIRTLHRSGIGIGSHGLAHVRWTGLDEAEIIRHVTASLGVLTDIIGQSVDRVSVPFGAYDGRVLAVLRRLAVARVYNSDFGPAWPGAWMLARNSIKADTPLEEIRTLIEQRYGLLDGARARLRQWRRSRPRPQGASA